MKIKIQKRKMSFCETLKVIFLLLIVEVPIILVGLSRMFGEGLVGLAITLIFLILGGGLVIFKLRKDDKRKPKFIIADKYDISFYKKIGASCIIFILISVGFFLYSAPEWRIDQHITGIRITENVQTISMNLQAGCYEYESEAGKYYCIKNELEPLGEELIKYKTDTWLDEWILLENDPDTSLERGYGDCDNRAVFYASVLKDAGFETYLVFQRNHMCTGVRIKDKMYFMGCFDFEELPLKTIRKV